MFSSYIRKSNSRGDISKISHFWILRRLLSICMFLFYKLIPTYIATKIGTEKIYDLFSPNFITLKHSNPHLKGDFYL